jgi:hypothetical protein
VCLLVDKFPLASPAADVPADGGYHNFPTVVQFLKLVAGFLSDFGEPAHGLGDGGEPTPYPRFDRVGRIDVLNGRSREFQ